MNPTQKVQAVEAWEAQFKRKLALIEINGVSKSLSAWSKDSGIALSTLERRYKKGIRGTGLLAPRAYKGYGCHKKPGPRKKKPVQRIWCIFYKRLDSDSLCRLEYRFGDDTKEKKNKLEFVNRSEARRFCYQMNLQMADMTFITKMIQGDPYKRKTKREYEKIRERKI